MSVIMIAFPKEALVEKRAGVFLFVVRQRFLLLRLLRLRRWRSDAAVC